MPKMPRKEQIREYADKWLKGTITPEEKKLFEDWYNEQAPEFVAWPGNDSEEQIQQQIFDSIDKTIREDKKNSSTEKSKMRIGRRIAVAAAVLLVLSISVLKWLDRDTEKTAARTESVKVESILDKTADYTRHLTLPDGSTVILHANSKLDYLGNFSENSREVILVGEAYFDIIHDEKRPFIIHTGDIKTTVLGTAFNINASANSKKITISVTRGKVRVEKNQKVLAVLTQDEQVTYNPSEPGASQQQVNAAAIVTDWTKQDMVFEDISFERVSQLLSRRYAVDINFKNPSLKNCTIKAFFNGTEPLEKVLDVLCIISNASYTKTDNKSILLDGQGCGE